LDSINEVFNDPEGGILSTTRENMGIGTM